MSTQSPLEKFAPLHQAALSAGALSSSWWQTRQARAWEQCQALGWPRSSDEAWKYLNLSALGAADFSVPSDEISAHALLPLMNNQPEGMQICSFAEAGKPTSPQHTHLREVFSRVDNAGGHDVFTWLNEALLPAEGGIFISLAPGVKANVPVHLLHNALSSTPPAAVSQQLRVLVYLGEGAELSCSGSYVGSEDNSAVYCTNVVWDFVLEQNARVQFFQHQAEDASAFHFAKIRVLQERSSVFSAYHLSLGAGLSRVDFSVEQKGQAAETQISSLLLAQDAQQSEIKTTLCHRGGEGRSDQYHKAVLADKAKGIFHGLIKIHKEAAKTQANLLNKNLLLDQGCEMDTRPQLEIDTDDVKCSHGATVSQLQAEELFYLQSRGIPLAQARSILSYAYVAEFLQRVEAGPIKQQWTALLARFIAKKAS